MSDSDRIFNELYEETKTDSNILGFVLAGSRGKEIVTKHSDYDVYFLKNNDKFPYKMKEIFTWYLKLPLN